MTLIERKIPYVKAHGFYLIDAPEVARAFDMLLGTHLLSERQFKALEAMGFNLIENPND